MEEFNSEWSCLSKIKRDVIVKQIDGTPAPSPYEIDKQYGDITEPRVNEMSTRSDLKNIEEHTGDLVAIFGDSFIYGDGLPMKYCLSSWLNKKGKDSNVRFINLAKPGSSNEAIMRRLEQWTNEELCDKTKTIVIGLSSMLRHSFLMNLNSPGLDKPSHPIYNRALVGWDFHVGLPPEQPVGKCVPGDNYPDELRNFQENFKRTNAKCHRAMNEAWNATNLYLNTPANSFIKNIEVILRRIHWLTLAKKWNIVFVDIQFWEQSNNQPDDWKMIYKYLEDMNIPERKVEIVQASYLLETLDCGHWTHDTMKSISNNIWDAYGKINNG